MEVRDRQLSCKDKEDRIQNQVVKRKREILLEKQMIAEKHRMHEADALQNNKRIATLKNIRNYKIFEKHALKEKVISDYNASVSSLSKFM